MLFLTIFSGELQLAIDQRWLQMYCWWVLTNRIVWWPLCLVSTCLGSGQSCTPGACHQLVMGHSTHRHCLYSVPLPCPLLPAPPHLPSYFTRLTPGGSLTANMTSVAAVARGPCLCWSGWGAPRYVSLGPTVLPCRGCAALERVNNAPDVLQRAACWPAQSLRGPATKYGAGELESLVLLQQSTTTPAVIHSQPHHHSSGAAQ